MTLLQLQQYSKEAQLSAKCTKLGLGLIIIIGISFLENLRLKGNDKNGEKTIMTHVNLFVKMLQHLIILLDDTSISFCYHKNKRAEKRLIPLSILKDGIIFGMKENLQIHFVLPEYDLPAEYWIEMRSIDSSLIVSANSTFDKYLCNNTLSQESRVIVFNDFEMYKRAQLTINQIVVLRLTKEELFLNVRHIGTSLNKLARLNLVVTNIDSFSEKDFEEYNKCLFFLSETLQCLYCKGLMPQLNVLTDRIMLKQMNNCNAGIHSITLAPDGCFYICPAFYQDENRDSSCNNLNVGTLNKGLMIENQFLYELKYSPLCRICDSYHCKRCIWLNFKTTNEVNTPSHEQCIVSHLERNASRELLQNIRKRFPDFMFDSEIKHIDYLEPLDLLI